MKIEAEEFNKSSECKHEDAIKSMKIETHEMKSVPSEQRTEVVTTPCYKLTMWYCRLECMQGGEGWGYDMAQSMVSGYVCVTGFKGKHACTLWCTYLITFMVFTVEFIMPCMNNARWGLCACLSVCSLYLLYCCHCSRTTLLKMSIGSVEVLLFACDTECMQFVLCVTVF